MIVMKYLSGYEDLYEYLQRKDKNFDEVIAASIILQILDVRVVNYLRQRGIDHRDLKLENILSSNRTKQIKIIDFGCASRSVPVPKPTSRKLSSITLRSGLGRASSTTTVGLFGL